MIVKIKPKKYLNSNMPEPFSSWIHKVVYWILKMN